MEYMETRWQTIARELYPLGGVHGNESHAPVSSCQEPADLYVRLAREYVQAVSFVDGNMIEMPDYSEESDLFVDFDDYAEQDRVAYRLGYDSLAADAMDNSYEELEKLSDCIRQLRPSVIRLARTALS